MINLIWFSIIEDRLRIELFSELYRKINLQRQLHFHQPSHPDFPVTEPDDRVNGMVARAVHVAEVNPEKKEPIGSGAAGQKNHSP